MGQRLASVLEVFAALEALHPTGSRAEPAPPVRTWAKAGAASEVIPSAIPMTRKTGSVRETRDEPPQNRRGALRAMDYFGMTVIVPVMKPLVAIEYGSHGASQFHVNVPVSLK